LHNQKNIIKAIVCYLFEEEEEIVNDCKGTFVYSDLLLITQANNEAGFNVLLASSDFEHFLYYRAVNKCSLGVKRMFPSYPRTD
ncbi:hypothetical protein L9F63_000915, partial [Diploptera punctata]